MSQDNQNADDLNKDDGSNAGGDQQSVEELKAALEKANGEAAKLRKIKKDLEAERNSLKQSKSDTSQEDYKQLWQEQQEKANKILEKVKTADIKSALAAQLQKAKVSADFADAALELVDKSLIEWDEDAGVNEQSVVATVQKFKGKYAKFFESKVSGSDIKEPAGGSSQDKTIKRAEFEKLSHVERADRMSKGYSLVD